VTKLLAFAACVAALVALLVWPGNADPARDARGYVDPARHSRAQSSKSVSADDVEANLRRSGLTPVGPVLRGDGVFVTHAVDPSGVRLRVVADALFGDIVSAVPAQPAPLYVAHGGAGPRIIHIPQRGDVRASIPQADEDEAAVGVDDDAQAAAPPPAAYRQPRAAPRPRETRPESRRDTRRKYHNEYRRESRRHEPSVRHAVRAAPKPAIKPEPVEVKASRSVLAIPPTPVKAPAPPPPATPPRWQAAEKFDAPRDAAAPPAAAAASGEATQALANEPVAVAPIAPDLDTPPEGITADPLPAR
jgi:hypothetical protein